MKKIKRALISTYDKTNLVELGKKLTDYKIEILSTGGTAHCLREAGIDIRDISDYTGFPEMLDGRLKTLHPKIHGGLLALRENSNHIAQTQEHGIQMIDMVVCNLYPFEATVSDPDVELASAIENIDIGGPTMIRSAAKNYQDVAVLTSSQQYADVIAELTENDGCLSSKSRFDLAKAAFTHTALYDKAISNYLTGLDQKDVNMPEVLGLQYNKWQDLRYGENPHQSAAFYRAPTSAVPCVAWSDQLNGQPLSYNNLLDLEAALEIVKDFPNPTCSVIKHNNPCGLATHTDLGQAFLDALDCDRVSAFGSIVGFNKKVDLNTANLLREEAKAGIKIEAIIAPSFTSEALKQLSRVKTRRILATGELVHDESALHVRNITNGILVQSPDFHDLSEKDLQLVTNRKPTEDEMRSLFFSWKACKHVKSNAILLVQGTKTVGIGAGQMSRVDSSIIAVRKAGDRAIGAVLASDAFFPFPDGVETAGKAGITAVIQPGGSVSDEAVIEMANKYDMAMVFTGVRHFKH